MKRFLALSLILGVTSFGLVGCGEETTKVEDTATVETPGGESTTTTTTETTKSGENAPAPPPVDAPPAEAPK